MFTSTLLKVDGTAWTVANEVEDAIRDKKTSSEIASSLSLDYTTSAHNVKTDIDEPVEGYWGIYRDDTNKFLGISVCDKPNIVQNVDTFKSLEPMIANEELTPVCADSYNEGRQFWGCFKYNRNFQVLGDDFDQYFIVINNHMKPNGDVTVVNTPIRIACMNAMGYALNRSTLKFSIPAIVNESQSEVIVASVNDAFDRTQKALAASAEKLASTKITKAGIEKLLDDLFPYIDEPKDSSTNHDRANQFVSAQREAFITCLNEDNLNNFKGTAYQVYNALTDYATHYFRNGNKGLNLSTRMSIVPGVDSQAQTNSAKVVKFLKNVGKFADAA